MPNQRRPQRALNSEPPRTHPESGSESGKRRRRNSAKESLQLTTEDAIKRVVREAFDERNQELMDTISEYEERLAVHTHVIRNLLLLIDQIGTAHSLTACGNAAPRIAIGELTETVSHKIETAIKPLVDHARRLKENVPEEEWDVTDCELAALMDAVDQYRKSLQPDIDEPEESSSSLMRAEDRAVLRDLLGDS